MHLDGAFGDGQLTGDHLVRQTLGDQFENVTLTWRQLLDIAFGAGAVLTQAGRQDRRQRLA
ncbi:hypothetical protein D3C75_1262190 [compost metagenome]